MVPALVLAALALRLYYVWLTREQPVWWDEAEYLVKARGLALGTPETGWFIGRPIFFSILLAGTFVVPLGELAIRLALAVAGAGAVWLTFRIGRRTIGDLGALVGAALLAAHYVPLFYGARVMTEVPHLALGLLSLDLFLDERPSRRRFALPVLALATLVRFTSPLLAVPMLAHLLLARGRGLRGLVGSAAVAALVLAPYFAWSWWRFGDPLQALRASGYLMPSLTVGGRLDGLAWYLSWLRQSLGWAGVALVLAGAALAARGLLAPRRLIAGDTPLAAGVVLVVWLLVPFLYFGLFVRAPDAYDRYAILALPPLFLLAGLAVARTAGLLLGSFPRARLGLALVVIAVVGAPLLSTSDTQIRGKLTSFAALRDAGAWLKENAPPGTRALTTHVAQLTYSSWHEAVAMPNDPVKFARLVADPANRYVVFTNVAPPPGWLPARALTSLGFRKAALVPPGTPTAQIVYRP